MTVGGRYSFCELCYPTYDMLHSGSVIEWQAARTLERQLQQQLPVLQQTLALGMLPIQGLVASCTQVRGSQMKQKRASLAVVSSSSALSTGGMPTLFCTGGVTATACKVPFQAICIAAVPSFRTCASGFRSQPGVLFANSRSCFQGVHASIPRLLFPQAGSMAFPLQEAKLQRCLALAIRVPAMAAELELELAAAELMTHDTPCLNAFARGRFTQSGPCLCHHERSQIIYCRFQK
jgi:hypothetical protein